jgi:dihydroneopterin aldolase
MDKVCISGLKMDAVIGIHDWEREIRQPIVLDIEMATDCLRAAETDAIEQALDYAAISTRLIDLVTQSEYQLIETLAEEIARVLQLEFQVHWLSLRVSKPGAVPEADNISVLIERGASL